MDLYAVQFLTAALFNFTRRIQIDLTLQLLYNDSEYEYVKGASSMLHPGLYEQVINNQLTSELSSIPEARKAIAPIDKAEASKVLAQYLADVVQRGLDNVVDNGGDISAQIALTNQIVDLIQTTTKEADFASMGVAQRAAQLLALLRENDPRLLLGKTAADMDRPETSVAQSSLFTGAIHAYGGLQRPLVRS